MGKHDPSLRFRVEEANRPELFTALIDNKFDVLLCPQSTKVPDGVLQHAVFDEVLEVVARNGHALVNSSESLGLSALIGYPWIVHPAGTPRRAIWELLFRNAGLEPPLPWVECKSFEATRELLLRSEALAMVAPDQYRIEREQGLLTAIHPVASDQTRSIVIATRASWIPDAAEALLVQTLRKLGASHDRGHL
jgi:DNA-binding transcriptional LysR family regulator